jgi:stage II sporulation protein D
MRDNLSVLIRRFSFCIIVFSVTLSSNTFAIPHRVYGVNDQSVIPRIKVLVQKSLKRVFISGTDISRKFHFNNLTKVFSGRKSIKFNCHKLEGKFRESKPTLLASLASQTGIITVGKQKRKKYKGSLHIVAAEDSRSCNVISESSLEDYLPSLLSKEMNGSWPIEALKAQAVAARTYALHKVKSKQVSLNAGYKTYYDLESSEKHQVSGGYFDSTKSTRMATEITSGYILVDRKGEMSPLFFHAGCGGRTLVPQEVWQNKVNGYKSVQCTRCHRKRKNSFSNRVAKKKIINFLRWAKKMGHIKESIIVESRSELHFLKDYSYGRKVRLYIDNELLVLKKSLLRRYFGRVIVPSNNFKVSFNTSGQYLSLKGKGYGHGVGMCQLGALEMAQKGSSYEQILSHYFPNHRLKKIY